MYKLIMADIKVLGHRLWIIPVGVLVIVLGLWSIFGEKVGKFPYPVAIISIIAGILGYELMKNHENNKLHFEISSLPVSKNEIVIQKYLMLVLFLIYGVIVQVVFSLIINLLVLGTYSVSEVLESVNFTIIASIIVALFVIPIFFKLKSSRKSFFYFIIWFVGLVIVHSNISLNILNRNEDVHYVLGIYIIVFATSLLCTSIFYVLKRKKEKLTHLSLIPIFLLLPSSIISFLDSNFKIIIYFFKYKNVRDDFYIIMRNYYIGNYLLHLGVTLVLLTILIVLWKKFKIKDAVKKLMLVMLVPVLLSMLSIIISSILSIYFDVKHESIITHYTLFIPMFFISFHYSKKFLKEGE